MSGLTATILLRSSFTLADTVRVAEILCTFADRVTETRKGLHWEFTVHNVAASLSVLSPFEHSYDFEDDLLANDLLFDDAPDAFLLCFSTRRDGIQETCSKLAAQLSESFSGINCELRNGTGTFR